MLRRNSHQSTILPNHAGGNTANRYISYGSNSYGGNDNHLSYSSSVYGKKRASFSSEMLPSVARKSSSWLALGLGFFVLLSGYYQSKFQWVMKELHVSSADEIVQNYRSLSEQKKNSFMQMDERYSILERLNAKLHKEKEDLRTSYEKKTMKEFSNRRAEEDRMVAREEAFKAQIQRLQDAASKEAKRAIIDKFGPGPTHHVEFTFILPSDANETEHNFVVETAPVNLMPHAVQLFLEQVDHRLWDNSWFYINGPHVLQAGPMLEEDDTIEEDTFAADRAAALKPFIEAELANLNFPEYNAFFPHEKWTLGYTGRPGGPDWYINKQNNTIMHGPGGQFHHDIEESADPCFAKVVEGFDKVEMMFNEATIEEGDDWEYFFWDPIFILKAEVIEKARRITFTSATTASAPSNATDDAPQETHQHHKKHHADFHKFPKIEHEKA